MVYLGTEQNCFIKTIICHTCMYKKSDNHNGLWKCPTRPFKHNCNAYSFILKEHFLGMASSELLTSTFKFAKNILLEHLYSKKFRLKWMPCLLTEDQKQQRGDDSESNYLAIFQRNQNQILRRYITVDERSLHTCV